MLLTYAFLAFAAAATIAALAWDPGSIDIVIVAGQGVAIGLLARLTQVTSRLDKEVRHGGK